MKKIILSPYGLGWKNLKKNEHCTSHIEYLYLFMSIKKIKVKKELYYQISMVMNI